MHGWFARREKGGGGFWQIGGWFPPQIASALISPLPSLSLFLLTVFKAGSVVNTFLLYINTGVADVCLNSDLG